MLKGKNYPYAKRFLSFLVDWYLSTFLTALPVYVVQSFQAQDLVINNRIDNLPLPQAVLAALLGLVVYTFYFCIWPLKTKKTQTLGRKLFNLELSKIDQSEVRFQDLFLRDFVSILLLQGNLTTANVYLMTFAQELTATDIIPYYQSFYTLTVLISTALFFVRKQRQTLHDLISKTEVRESN